MLALSVAVIPLATAGSAIPGSGPADPGHGPGVDDVETTDAAGPERNGTAMGTDGVLLYVDVAENGSARWQVEYRTRLDDRSDAAAFERLRRDLETDAATPNDGFFERIRRTVESAENATGREMTGTGFAVETTVRRIPREYGVVVYSFRWHGFASTADGELRVGDALEGFFLGSGERLVLSWPDGYELAAVDPAPDARRDHTVTWRGPTAFGSDGPRVRLAEPAWTGSRVLPVGAALVGLGLVGVWSLRRRDGVPLTSLVARSSGDDGEDPELLSNEERVVRLLDERGGRLKQQAVAEELGWTEAKTSYVVSGLREDGRIRSFRIGRENVLSLPESSDSGRSDA